MSVVVSRRSLLQMAMVPAFLTRAQVADLAPTVSRVYPGTDGRLVYVPDEQGNTIHDSSHAGYAGGGVPIPTVPVKLTIWPVAGDNTEHLQAAIDKVSALPQDKSGFRGAVLLRAGYYRMAMPLRIQASGVVLRGEGMGDTGTILVGTGTGRPPAPPGAAAGPGGGPGGGFGGGQATLVQIAGASGISITDQSKQLITDEYVPVGARSFRVVSAQGFKPGETVIVRRISNEDWIAAIGMNGETPQTRWKPFNVDFDRVVTEVQGNTITIDAPITCAIEKRWGGGEVMKYEIPAASRRLASRTSAACRNSTRQYARRNTATWTARTTSPRSTTPTKITIATSSPSTTCETGGCAMRPRCISSTAW